MRDIDNSLLEYISQENLSNDALDGEYGIEKENLRVDETGRLALTPHPPEFGYKLYNPYIKTDFSESQVEMVTPICDNLEAAYNFLENLQNIISLTLKGEYLWPQSNPPILPEEEQIPIAVFRSSDYMQMKYRERLAEKYGRKKQMFSGVHVNFSFKDNFLKKLYAKFGKNASYRDFKDNLYLKLTKNLLKHRWLLVYLTGASPVFHNSFDDKLNTNCNKLDDESYCFKDRSSLRNSEHGYHNIEEFFIDYSSLEGYVRSLQALIDAGKLQSSHEFYSPVRLKSVRIPGKDIIEQLSDSGIKYIEIRLFDLNPFSKNGISLEDLHFVNLFVVYLLLKQDLTFDEIQQKISNKNHFLATVMSENVRIYNDAGELVSLKHEALKIIDEMAEMVQALELNNDYLTNVIKNARERVMDTRKSYAHRIIEEVKRKSFIGFHMEKAREYLEDSEKRGIHLIGYEDLELSTQILLKDSIKKGIKFEILDREENFVRLTKGQKVEYVKQATKTSKDSYITALIMENKLVTKEVLKQHNIRVPHSELYNNLQDAARDYDKFKDKKIVVKPKTTNFGIGISIFQQGFSKQQFERALAIAFEHDKTVLVEDFVNGKEYRFLVIGDEVVGVLRRVPANVEGDGKKTIRRLVDEKNNDPLRGEGHKTPLEKIKLGEIEEMYLKSQGKDFDYIPKKGEVVFLRENSNISTGGDSIDCTDDVHESYKALAIKSAKAVGAAITGVDMIIEDIKEPLNESNYAIIELNFNPAMYMHCYPYKGKDRKAGDKILDLLFGKE